MTRFVSVFALGLLTATSGSVGAQSLDDSDAAAASARALIDMCAATGDSSDAIKARIFCHGFLTGTLQFHNALVSGGDFRPIACPSAGVTRAEAARALAEWGSGRSDLEQISAVEGLARAAQAKWPCG
ncbi:MAG: Rap1a/Tai family immunity protein [Pseudomonadota bacterium]